MRIYRTAQEVPSGSAVTIGNFDGLHLGHQQIITELRQSARQSHSSRGVRNPPAGLITFEPSPQLVIHQEFPYILTPFDEKTECPSEMGLDFIYLIEFTTGLRATAPEVFFEKMVIQPLKPSLIVVGYDYRFGSDRQGDTALLSALREKYGFELKVIPEFRHDGEAVKSTRIRERLVLGAVRQAAELLGRHYSIRGKVVHGQGIGHDLGFPTVNLQVSSPEKLIPAPGVYAVHVLWANQPYSGVMNIGFRPTFTDSESHASQSVVRSSLEVHLLDFTNHMYDQILTVEFVERLRPEAKFGSTEGLKRQIAADVAFARLILADGQQPAAGS